MKAERRLRYYGASTSLQLRACHAGAKRRREAREPVRATADHMAAAPCRHRALSRPTAEGDGASASNRKEPHCVPQAFLQHTGEKGVHGGKSKVSPRAPCAVRSPKNIAHFYWLAWHIACRGAALRRLVRISTEDYGEGSTWCSECHVHLNIRGAWLTRAKVLLRTHPYQSVLHSPHIVLCAMRPASQQSTPYFLFFVVLHLPETGLY